MVNPLVQNAILVFIVLFAIVLILTIGKPIIDRTQYTESFKQVELTFQKLDNYITEVASEPKGSRRKLSVSIPFTQEGDEIRAIPGEDIIQYEFSAPLDILEYLSRRSKKNLLYIAGSDVTCNETASKIFMENTHLKMELKKVAYNSPLNSINTSEAILNITQKDQDVTIEPADSSIILDNDTATGWGDGYSEILKNVTNAPLCIAHFYVEPSSSIVDSYDVYYILYAGADFVEVSVRNVKWA